MMDTSQESLTAIDWKSVRRIYKKLSDEFKVLTGAFNVTINDETKLQLDHLIIAIDAVDNTLDEITSDGLRKSISEEMLTFLKDSKISFTHQKASHSLNEKLNNLKLILGNIDKKGQFIQATKDILEYTELKRHTKEPSELIAFVVREGTATAELPLSIMNQSANKEFREFFTELCELMGIVDLLFDLRRDYKNKLISIKPTLKLYVKLMGLSISKSLRIFCAFPKKLSFIHYCLKFAITLINE